jgi:hypothetical protein
MTPPLRPLSLQVPLERTPMHSHQLGCGAEVPISRVENAPNVLVDDADETQFVDTLGA